MFFLNHKEILKKKINLRRFVSQDNSNLVKEKYYFLLIYTKIAHLNKADQKGKKKLKLRLKIKLKHLTVSLKICKKKKTLAKGELQKPIKNDTFHRNM